MGTLNSVLASERRNLESRRLLVGKPGVLGYLPGLPTGDTGNAGKDTWIKPKGGPGGCQGRREASLEAVSWGKRMVTAVGLEAHRVEMMF